MKAIITRFRGPTDTLGARITASDGDGNRITIPYPHELDSYPAHIKAASALCRKMGWTGRYTTASTLAGYVHVPVFDLDVWEVE